MIIQKSTYKAHPAGLFDFIIGKIEPATITDKTTGKDKELLRFTLCTDEGEITPLVSPALSEKSNLGKLCKAVFGAIPEELDTDKLLGAAGRVLVGNEDKDGLTVDRVLQYMKRGGQPDPFLNV